MKLFLETNLAEILSPADFQDLVYFAEKSGRSLDEVATSMLSAGLAAVRVAAGKENEDPASE